VDAERALFYVHTQRPNEAQAALNEALQADPNLPLAHEAQGLLAYSQQNFDAAEAAFSRAIELHSTSFFPYYFAAEAELRHGFPTGEQSSKLIALLEKTVAMNPQFAPAYAALSSIYSMHPETREKALADGRKAIELEPGNVSVATSYGFVLLNAGKVADARVLAGRIQEVARTPAERENVQQLFTAIASREEYDREAAAIAERAKHQESIAVVALGKPAGIPARNDAKGSSESTKTVAPASAAGVNRPKGTEFAVEGNVASADCGNGPGKVTLSVNKTAMKFRFADSATLQVVTTAKQDSAEPPACSNWKGRRVRLYFYKLKDKEFLGELDTIQFF